MKRTLVIMAAGIGSRFSGVKQLAKVGPNGEVIIDYAISAALGVGFNKIVFIIRRDIEDDFKDVLKYSDLFGDMNIKNRAMHVASECERMKKFVEALRSGDLRSAGKLMNKSHISLRDDFEVSCGELDILAEAAQKYPRVLGARA